MRYAWSLPNAKQNILTQTGFKEKRKLVSGRVAETSRLLERSSPPVGREASNQQASQTE